MSGHVTDMAAKRAELSPEAVAFTDDETGTSWRFDAVDDTAARLGAGLLAQGLAAGDRVAILCHNRVEFFLALFACQKAGLILAPMNWRQPAPELGPVADSVGIAAMIHDAANAETATALAAARGVPCIGIETASPTLDDLVAGSAPLAPRAIDENAPWYLLFTSGTTGTPKAVIQTARMGLANAMNVAQSVGLTMNDSSVNFLPLFHTAGINLYTLPLFLWGGHSRVLRRFDADRLLALIAAGEVTQFFGVPAIYQALRLHPEIEATPLSAVRGYGCGGAALPEEQITWFAERGAVICNGFGMTETGPMGFLLEQGAALERIGSVGKPQMLTEARIADAPATGPAEGELQMRGPSVTPGYFANAEATRATFTEDGWLRSGDIVRRDADGYYRIVDRMKDMYISGGENVYPAEVERVLVGHPDILEAAVVGVPDAKWGEVGAAYLIARPGATPDMDALPGWCRERIAGYKVPASFTLMEDFPRTAAGKVRKTELRGNGT